ncbi:MAG: DUF456 domain-containing protein [Desulfobacterota bacterium]|jgi:uncharacterized protein YqgC (DUF456 family)|nr:DUF456 domain-containing protein [Thermodesulfobacteriota bacterium]
MPELIQAAIWVLCLAGIFISLFALSGTWLVAGAAVAALFLPEPRVTGIWTVFTFLALAALMEVLEWLAGAWGVYKRGGSRLASLMALVGGVAGFFLGFSLPIPLIGNFVGMLLLSFLLVFLVERQRLGQDRQAAHIALGAVLARVIMVLVKTGAALGMSFWLLWRIYG